MCWLTNTGLLFTTFVAYAHDMSNWYVHAIASSNTDNGSGACELGWYAAS